MIELIYIKSNSYFIVNNCVNRVSDIKTIQY